MYVTPSVPECENYRGGRTQETSMITRKKLLLFYVKNGINSGRRKTSTSEFSLVPRFKEFDYLYNKIIN